MKEIYVFRINDLLSVAQLGKNKNKQTQKLLILQY